LEPPTTSGLLARDDPKDPSCSRQLAALTQCPNIDHRAGAPSLLRIPELDAANPASITREINNTCFATFLDPFRNRKVGVGSVLEVNKYSLKLNRSTLDTELKRSKTLATVQDDSIVIVSAIYIHLSDALPTGVIAARVSANDRTTTPSIEIHVWTRAPTSFRIPKLDAADPAAVTRKVNLTGPSATGDSVPNLNVVVSPVLEMDNHALKLNGSASDLKLKRSETFAVVHDNPVVIVPSVDIGSPELLPATFVAASLRA
jgi:hypothetical protein